MKTITVTKDEVLTVELTDGTIQEFKSPHTLELEDGTTIVTDELTIEYED